MRTIQCVPPVARVAATLALLCVATCCPAFADARNVAGVEGELTKRSCAGTCPLAYRCDPYYESPIWAITDGVCRVYRNSCLFSSANCNRRNECLSEMSQANKTECQQHCASGCDSQPQLAVCGYFPRGDRTDEMLTFGNQCELDKMSCLNGKAYSYSSEGACS